MREELRRAMEAATGPLTAEDVAVLVTGEGNVRSRRGMAADEQDIDHHSRRPMSGREIVVMKNLSWAYGAFGWDGYGHSGFPEDGLEPDAGPLDSRPRALVA